MDRLTQTKDRKEIKTKATIPMKKNAKGTPPFSPVPHATITGNGQRKHPLDPLEFPEPTKTRRDPITTRPNAMNRTTEVLIAHAHS